MKYKIFLIEDHDEALKVWRKEKIKGLDLVHIDAHMDFGLQLARPIETIFKKAKSMRELKKNLEYSIAFKNYEDDFDKQTNIGNYVYPAMEEGIVRDFYWVIPGGRKEFKASLKFVKNTIRRIGMTLDNKIETTNHKLRIDETGLVSATLFGRKFYVCTLEKLAFLKERVLLDIDTDFLVIDSVVNSNNTTKIGKRKPWISAQEFQEIIEKKIKQPKAVTIAYSVNGGYTPIKYKHLGDEVAYYLAPKTFAKQFKNNYKAAQYFALFDTTGKKEYYRKAVKLNPTYRVSDNNYGLLYFSLRRFSQAKREFSKVLSADPNNPGALLGLGNIALERIDYKTAKKYFSSVLISKNCKSFSKLKKQSLLGLAKAEFALGKLKSAAKGLFLQYRQYAPLEPQSYYFLGRIFEKERDFESCAKFYQDALRLGFNSPEILSRLLKISCFLKNKYAIIKFTITNYKTFKKVFLRQRRLSLKEGRQIRGLSKIEKRMMALERKLNYFIKSSNFSNENDKEVNRDV